tara:strand:- start:131 stop:9163 length:9033 start_codon:yes stop_codon:yes gene_type:complete
MYIYLINGKEVTFENDTDLLAGLHEAEMMGYSIEDITDKKKKPKEKEEEKDPILESIEANTPKEDFTQGPVERADAASETVAQDGMVSPSADGSSGFQPIPLGDGTMPDVGGSVPFSIDGKEVTEKEYKEYEKTFAPEPKFITDPIQIGSIQGEIDQIETSLQGFGFSQSNQGKEALKRQQYLQNQLDETVSDRMFAIYEMPAENQEQALTVLSDEQRRIFDATKMLAKDTNAYSGSGEESFFPRLYSQFTGAAKDLLRIEETPSEVITYDKNVYAEIVKTLSKDATATGRLRYDTMTLDQKEGIIKNARSSAYKKVSEQNKAEATNIVEDFNKQNLEVQIKVGNLKNQINEIKGNTPDNELTLPQVTAINNVIDQINNVISDQKSNLKTVDKQFKNLENSQKTLAGSYGIDVANQTINNAFFKSDQIKKFKDEESAKMGGFAQGINSLVQGFYQISTEFNLGLGTEVLGVSGSKLQELMSGDDSYNIYDAFIDTVSNNINFDVLGVKPSEAFTEGRETTAQDWVALLGDTMPFTAKLIVESRKGKISSLENAIGTLTTKSKGVKNLLSAANKDFIMVQSTVKSLALSNYTDALDKGLNKTDALLYSSQMTMGTGMVQMVMPDFKFLEGSKITLSTMKDIAKGNVGLGTIASIQAGKNAGIKLLGNFGGEVIEEEIELMQQRWVNSSFALANSDFFSGDWYTEQKQLLGGVTMMSGGLGSIGAYKTAVDTYSSVLLASDAQIELAGFQLQTQLEELKKLAPEKLENPTVQKSITDIESSISYINQLKTAKTMAPNNVTGQELAYLTEKVDLIEKNKKLDPSFRAKNDERIKEIDNLIAESRTVKFIKDAAEKDVKVAENIRKSLNLGAEIEAYNTQEEVDARVQALKNRANNEPIDTSAYGAIIPMKDGSDVIIINKSAAIRDGRINTAAHELLHRYLKNTFKTEGDTVAAGKALDEYYESLGLDSDGEFEARRKQYADEFGVGSSTYNEEIITLLSEAMLDNKVKSNQGTISKLIEGVKNLLKANEEITLNDGKSVFNFVKEYNKSIKKGKATKKIAKGAAGIKGTLIKGEGKAITPTTNKSMQIEALEQAYFDLQDQAAEDPNNLALYERMEKAGDALDAALAAPAKEVTTSTEAVQEAPKEVIVRPKADKSKRKYSLDKEVKKEIEPKIAEAQKLNKELIAQEKKLNADAIAEIEAIDDNVESRTSREKRIVALKNKPLTVKKPPALNKLEKEITEALETPISKAVNLFTKLYYDKIAKNATAAVTREEFMQSAKAEITNLTINEFKPETVNRAGEDVINDIEDIIFQRGGLRLRNLAQRLGVIGKDQGISRGAEALTKIAVEDSTTTAEPADKKLDSGFKGEIRKPSALLANEALIEEAKKKIIQFWEVNKGNKKVENFKNLPIIIDSILAEVYGIDPGTLTARSGNFNKVTYQNAITAFTAKQAVFRTEENGEMVEVRVPYDQRDAKLEELKSKAKENSNFTFEEYSPESRAEGILRFLPELSVPEYKYFSGKRGRSAGKSTGMPRSFTNLAYLVTGRRTQAQGNREGEIQKISRQELLEAIGAIDDIDGNPVPDVAKAKEAGKAINKMPGAQTLLSLIKLEGRMIANQMSREFGNLDPMTDLDIKMGKNKTMYSAKLKIAHAPVDIEMFNPKNFKNKAIPYEAADEIYKILKAENKIRKKKLDMIEVSNIIQKVTAKKYGREVGAVYRNAALGVMQKFDPAGYTKAEAQIKLIKDLQYSFGQAFKYVIENKAINKEWSKVEALKGKEVSKETKIQVIKDYVERWNRAGRDIDYRRGFDFLKATNNTAVFDAIKEATGLNDAQLKNLGFTLAKTGGLVTINFEGKPLKLSTPADSLKKDLNSTDVAKNNAAAMTINKEASAIRKVMFAIIDPFIKRGDIEGAKAVLALMNLSQNGIARKLGRMGSLIKINADDKTILDHNPSMSDVNAKIIEYIEGKRSKTSLNSYLDKTTINNISEQLNDLLEQKGGLESKRYEVLKNVYAKINVNYAAKEVAIAKENNYSLPLNLRQEGISLEESIKRVENFDKAITLGNSLDQPTKGISVWDFDDTLAKTKSSVLYTMPDGKAGKLDAAEFAKEGDAMLANGAKFDFSEFSKVVKGEKGPFFEKAMARNKKFGNENVFILTARPANSALAIHEFLKGIGLDIPLANITGLANSDPQAKANWVLGKFAEGYNDFYFADDHIGNVNAVKKVLDVLDVKSKVQQARVRYSMDLNKRFNQIIEEKSGIESFKEYQSVKAKKKGAKKGRLSFFIPPSAEDFMGLLYKTLPKGKKGESAMAFYKEHLIDPYWKGVSGLRTQRISIAKQYRALKKELGIVPRKLKKTFKYEDENGNMKESLFSKEDAIRVYVWDAQGFDIDGLSNVDLPVLVNYVNSQPELKAFADRLLEINKNNDPKAPTESWPGGTITSDLLNTLNTEGRKKMLEVWQQNVDAIFTKTNLNKLEAAFGGRYVEALKSSLDAMKTGQNSKPTGNRVTDGFVRWLNAAVGNIMFLNRRSAVLQLISFTNFINFEGNNLYQAAKAFANQPQYWKDWVMLMNSDYLVDRRDGLKINVNEADIATTAKENGFQGVLAKVLQAGFIPTKMADSVAIATGGASFYRNKVNALIKGGMNKAAAEKQAMQDFIKTAETSQQSSDPAMTSKQQREPVGRIILAFANTPSQYARIIKRSTQDLIAGRGNPKTHLSRIAYYGFLQNAIFNFLQQGLFAAMMGDDDEEEEITEKQEESNNKKMIKTANSMVDGILRGIGVGGAVVSAVKNLAIKYYERSQKTRNQRLAETLKDGVTAVSPPLSSKLSKVAKVGNAMEWGKKEIEFDEMSLKHPYVTAVSNAIAAVTGLPTDRAVGMAIDAVDIASSETETWMKPLIALGWPKWQLMSEKDKQKEKEEKKERFKELEADKEFKELNPTEQRRSVLKKLSKKEQEEILWNSGVLTRKQIRNLKTEANRVDKIMALRNKKQFEKDMESLSKGGDILPEPKVTRPPTKRKDSLK